MKKRLISLLLAFSMMLTFLPAGAVSAFAEENIDSSKGTLIPNNFTGSVYTIAEDNTTYQMRGDYNFPIEITAKGVTINIVGKYSSDRDTQRVECESAAFHADFFLFSRFGSSMASPVSP